MPPDVADLAPSDPVLTAYDQEHAVTYMRLLDADAEGADWHEVARIVLHIDPERCGTRDQKWFWVMQVLVCRCPQICGRPEYHLPFIYHTQGFHCHEPHACCHPSILPLPI